MSPAQGLSRREQTRRGRIVLLCMALVLVVVAALALVGTDGEPEQTDTAAAPADPTSTTERAPSTATTTVPVSAGATTTAAGAGATTAPAATSAPTCDPAVAIRAWPLRRRVAMLVIVGVDPGGTGEATALAEDEHVGGLFLGGNATDLLTSGALQQLRAGSPTGLLVAVDEEGGRVQRIEGLDGEVPSAREMAATMTVDEVRALAERRGRVMAANGVTVDLAPVVDVSDQPDRTVIGDRSWSADPEVVVAYARAYAEGLLAAGVAPVLKHFPGHGEATGDTHEGPASTPALDQLRARDLVPYERLVPELGPRAGVMLGHLDVPGLTEPGTPSSLSPATVSLLRDEYGFTGVVMTDDLAAMASITDRLSPPEAAVAALAAGVDMALLSGADIPALLDRLEGAVGTGELDEGAVDASVARVLAYQGIDPCTVSL